MLVIQDLKEEYRDLTDMELNFPESSLHDVYFNYPSLTETFPHYKKSFRKISYSSSIP